MTSDVIIGTLCGIGLGLLAGIIFSIFYWKKKKNEQIEEKRRKSVPGLTIVPQEHIPFQIPIQTVPVNLQTPTRDRNPSTPTTLSPPVTPRSHEARRPSVQLEEILTSANSPASPRRQSPTFFSSTNETAIANLYSTQKRAITSGRKKMLKRSSTSCPFGKLEFTLFYDQNLQELQIYVVRGIQVYVPGSDGATSLMLKAVILFNGQEVWQDKTKVVEDGSDPDFSEQLIVHALPIKRMRKGLLKLIVLDKATEQAVSEVVYSLSNLPFNIFTTECMKLTEVDTQDYSTEEESYSRENGELLVSMCHNRNEKKLTVVVDCAKNLPVKYKGSVDSSVKVEIMYVGKKLYSRSTPVFNKNRNPDYGAKFDFVIPDDKLPQITVVLKVKRHGKAASHKPIGMVKLGYDAESETEYRHLEQVLDKPHLSIENWHILKKYK